MTNPVPVSVDEARGRPTKLKRSGRQRGAWVYLDADLLARAGIPADAEVEATRYALVERATRRDGSTRVRSRVILNLSIVTPTTGTQAPPSQDEASERAGATFDRKGAQIVP